MLDILGYIGALLIGIVLGITGGGGSILTVPVLVYILGYSPVLATAYSLFIVGTTSGFGSVLSFKKNLVVPKTALLFAVPSVTGVYITRKFIVPALPEVLFKSGDFSLTKGVFLMLLFASFMFMAAYFLLKPKKDNNISITPTHSNFFTIFQLFFVGVLIGLIGAGGGFLIIPALLKIGKLPMKKAIGTSLLIITINSIIGFTGDIQNNPIDWNFLLLFSGISIIGIFIGLYVQSLIDEKKLKRILGVFILTIACVILYKELLS